MTTNEATAVRAEMAALTTKLAAPLREQLGKLEDLIEERVVELEELRSARNEARRMLERVDPLSKPEKKTKPGPKTTTAGRVSPDTVNAVHSRMLEIGVSDLNGNGGFTVTSLRRDFGFSDIPQSTMQKAVAVLYERDNLRLDHRGRGGAHYYKVVS